MWFSLIALLLVGVDVALVLTANGATTSTRGDASLRAPTYRNVVAGDVWVYPNSSFDLGARTMSCECFDPSETCCKPQSTTIAPFCAIQNTTCCANTYCLAGETCCGDFCCAAETTCNVKLTGSGCCPNGEVCNSFATCFDYGSSNCSNTLSLKAGCCPVDAPYCRDFKPEGLGCYASSTMATSSLMTLGLPATVQTSGTPTVTISSVQNSDGMSLPFATNAGMPGAATTAYLLAYPSSPGLGTGSSVTVTLLPTEVSSLNSPSSLKGISTTKTSALCHNDDSKNPMPCPAVPGVETASNPSVQSVAISNGDIGYSPPGTSLYKSQASSLMNPFSALSEFVAFRYISCITFLLIPLHDLVTSIELGQKSLGSYHYFFILITPITGLLLFFEFSSHPVINLVRYGKLRGTTQQNQKDFGFADHLSKPMPWSEALLFPPIDKLNSHTMLQFTKLLHLLEPLPPDFSPTDIAHMLQNTHSAVTEGTRSAFSDIETLLILDTKQRSQATTSQHHNRPQQRALPNLSLAYLGWGIPTSQTQQPPTPRQNPPRENPRDHSHTLQQRAVASPKL